jgi:palmitoyltransferase
MFVMLIPSSSTVYSFVNGVIFNILAVLALGSHFSAMFSDPVNILRKFQLINL